MIKRNLVVASLLVTGALLQTNTAMAGGSVVGKVSTLGVGLEYVHPINDKLAIGVGVNGLSYDNSLEESDIDYDATLDMQSFSLIGDYHPFSNGFRLSAGILQNGNEFSLVGTPVGNETVEINGSSYTAADVGSLEGKLGFKSTAPYLGLGWGHAPKAGKGWAFDADVGVLFHGKPEASLTATCGSAFTNDVAGCNTFLSNVSAEENSFKSDTEDFDIMPVISIGASYRF